MILSAVTISVGSLLTDISVLCIITHNCLPSCSDKLITSRKYFSRVCRQKKTRIPLLCWLHVLNFTSIFTLYLISKKYSLTYLFWTQWCQRKNLTFPDFKKSRWNCLWNNGWDLQIPLTRDNTWHTLTFKIHVRKFNYKWLTLLSVGLCWGCLYSSNIKSSRDCSKSDRLHKSN